MADHGRGGIVTSPTDGWYVDPAGGGTSAPLATVTPIRKVVFEESPEQPPEPSPGEHQAPEPHARPAVRSVRAAPEQPAETASEKAAARRADRAANVSMNALTRRGMSRWELEQILVARELDPAEVEAELDRLAGVGLLDDAALAETIVRTQHERKGLGRSALVAEMRRRHIDPQQIDEALEQLDDDSELERAKELAHKRAPQLRSLDQTTAKRRLTAFLMRKGYPSSVIRTAVDEALDAGGSTVRFR